MPRLLVKFIVELDDEQVEDIESYDPALMHEWAEELAGCVVPGTLHTYPTND